MNQPIVESDERTTAVENTSYRWAYILMTFALLADVAYRGYVLGQAGWDLLGIVIAGGAVTTAYQGFHRVLSRSWLVTAMVAFGVAALIAVAVAYFALHR